MHGKIESLAPGMVAMVGVPWDGGSTYLRGAALGPNRIREALDSGAMNRCAESGVDLSANSRFRDVGDLPLADLNGDPTPPRCAPSVPVLGPVPPVELPRDPGGTEGKGGAGPPHPVMESPETCRKALDRIADMAGEIIRRGARILWLGGDHSVTWPLVRAVAGRTGPLTILHLDAHPDLYDAYEGNAYSHACPFARILEEGLASRVIQVGIRAANPHQVEQARRFGVEQIPMLDFDEGWVPDVAPPWYLSVDLDALDPAFVPGVAHHEPGGLTTRQVIDLIHRLPGPPEGADLVELCPPRDPSGVTAVVAAKLVKEIVACMEK